MHQIARPEPAVLLWTQTSEQTLLLWPRVFHKSTAIWLDSYSEVWTALALLCKEVIRSHLRDDQQTGVFTEKKLHQTFSNSSAVNSKASWVPFTPFDAWDTSPTTSGVVRIQRAYNFSTTLLFKLPAGSRVCWASTQTKEVRSSTTEPGAVTLMATPLPGHALLIMLPTLCKTAALPWVPSQGVCTVLQPCLSSSESAPNDEQWSRCEASPRVSPWNVLFKTCRLPV